MHLGIFAKTFVRPTFDEALDALNRGDFTHVQFNLSCVGLPTLPDRIDEDLCRAIARAHRDRGLTMAAISGTFNLCDPDEARLAANLERLDVLAEACRWLDTRIITLCTGTRDPSDMWKWHPENVGRAAWNTLASSVKRAAQIADRHEVTLAVEPEVNNVVSSPIRARKLLDEVGSPWLKIVIDPANLFRNGEPRPFSELLSEAFDWLGPDIVLAHAKPPHFPEFPGSSEWLNNFLDEPYRTLSQRALQKSTAGVWRGQQFPALLDEYRFKSFFQLYRVGLLKIAYDGPCIIHGIEESQIPDVVARLRLELRF
jgi:sugar phosphate isomerase/epimerase